MKLKLSKTAIRELTKQYRAVLLGCLIATMSSGANATVQVVGDITSDPVSVVTDVESKSSTTVYSVGTKTMQTVYTSSEVDSELVKYAKTADVNSALDGKADKSTTYTKDEVNSALSAKANAAEVNAQLATKLTVDTTSVPGEESIKVGNSSDTKGKVQIGDGSTGMATLTANGTKLLVEGKEVLTTDNLLEKGTSTDKTKGAYTAAAVDSILADYTVKTVDGTTITKDETGKISVGTIAQDQVTGLAGTLAGKQDNLNEAQLAAADSGITTEKVTKYDGYEATIAGKVTNAGQFTGESDSALIKGKTVVDAISAVANQTDTNTAALATLNGTVEEDGSILNLIQANAAAATYGDTTIGNAIQQNSTDISAVNALIGAKSDPIVDTGNGVLSGKILSNVTGTDNVTVATALGLLSTAANDAQTTANNAANLTYNGTASTFTITDTDSTGTSVEAYTKVATDTLANSLIQVGTGADADKVKFYTAAGAEEASSYTTAGADAAIKAAINGRFTAEGSGLAIDTDGDSTTPSVKLAGLGANTFTGDQTVDGNMAVSGTGTFGSVTTTGDITAAGSITAGTGTNKITLNASDGSISAASATISGALGAGSFSAGTNAFTVADNGDTTVKAKFKTEGEVNLSDALKIASGKMTIAADTTVNSMMTFASTEENKPSVSIDSTGISTNNGTSETFKLAAETGDMTVGGIATLTGGFKLGTDTIAMTAVDHGEAGLETGDANTLASTLTVLQSAENGVYTNSVETGSNIGAEADTLNKAIASVDVALGDVATLVNSTTGNLTNGGEKDPTDVATAIVNMDKTLGQIHGLQAKLQDGGDETSLEYKGTNLAEGTTVENHLIALDASIGNLKAVKSSNDAINSGATTNIATAFQAVGDAIGDQQFASTRYISQAETPDLSSALRTLDSNLGRVEDRIGALEHRTQRMRHEMRSGFASLAAMSGLVPKSGDCGDTQIAVGTGYYRGTTGFAVGAFHNLTNHVLLNAGASYAGNGSAIFKGGVTFGF